MHSKFVCMLGFFVVLPAYSAVNLPVVNVTSGGVSARSAFGDVNTVHENVSVAPARNVVARRANKPSAGVKYTANKTEVDVLSPNLPSSNLWAENNIQIDTPLRMPRMDEIAVLDNDFELPDENINPTFAVVKDDNVQTAQVARELETTMNRMAEIDAQIARLAELQRRADNSVKRQPVEKNNTGDVKISRMVVPMDEPDVLIRSVEKHSANNKPAKYTQNDLGDLSPDELRKAFRKTFLSENKHLSAMRTAYADDDDDTIVTKTVAGFNVEKDFSSDDSGIGAFEIKISFRNFDSSLSRDNYDLLSTFAGGILRDSKRAVQILIPNEATVDRDDRKLTARRLAIIEQVLRESGIPEQRILPVLSNRDDDGGLVLRNIDNTQYEILTKQQKNKFGKTTNKTYKSMTW